MPIVEGLICGHSTSFNPSSLPKWNWGFITPKIPDRDVSNLWYTSCKEVVPRPPSPYMWIMNDSASQSLKVVSSCNLDGPSRVCNSGSSVSISDILTRMQLSTSPSKGETTVEISGMRG